MSYSQAKLMLPLSVVILTYNEEKNIDKCLNSIRNWVEEIFIVDSGSTDQTLEIVKKYQTHIIHHSFETHARQWHWVLENLSYKNEWLLCLDADQSITSELAQELIQLFSEATSCLNQTDGFYIKRRQIFRGQWIQHGGYYPKYLLKLFRRTKVRTDSNDLVDHHFYVEGKVEKLTHDLVEENVKENDISFWIEKHNRYAKLLAKEEIKRRQNNKLNIKPSLVGSPDQKTLWCKQWWYCFPLYGRSFFYFIYRYFFRLGFLDGKEGFIFHFLQAFWFRLLVDVNIEELLNKKSEKS